MGKRTGKASKRVLVGVCIALVAYVGSYFLMIRPCYLCPHIGPPEQRPGPSVAVVGWVWHQKPACEQSLSNPPWLLKVRARIRIVYRPLILVERTLTPRGRWQHYACRGRAHVRVPLESHDEQISTNNPS